MLLLAVPLPSSGVTQPGGPPIATPDTFAPIELGGSTTEPLDVLANDVWDLTGTPVLTIDSQSGPGTAVVVGSGASSRLDLPISGLVAGTKAGVYRLAEGTHPDATAAFSVDLIGPAPVADDDVTDTVAEGDPAIIIDVLAGSTWYEVGGASTDRDLVTVVIEDVTGGGMAVLTTDGQQDIEYSPGAAGAVTIDFHLVDQWGLTSGTESVAVTVTAAGTVSIAGGTMDGFGGTSRNLQPTYPADVQADDYLACYVAGYCATSTPPASVTPPSGWSLVQERLSTEAIKQWCFAKDTVTGSETGIEEFAFSNAPYDDGLGNVNRLMGAQIFRVRGSHVDEDTVGAGGTAGVDNPISVDGVTVTGANALGLLFAAIRVAGTTAAAFGDITGESPDAWTARTSASKTLGTVHSMTIECRSANLSAETISGGTCTSDIAGDWGTMALAAGAVADAGSPTVPFPPTGATVVVGGVGDGVADDTAAIQASLASVTNGTAGALTRIQWGAGKTYSVTGDLNISNKSYFWHEGNGATIIRRAKPSGSGHSLMEIYECDNCYVFDLNFDGRRSVVGTGPNEFNHNLQLRHCVDFGLHRINSNNCGSGDGLHVTKSASPSPIPTNYPAASFIPMDGEITDVICDNNYRQGMSLDYGHRINIRRCVFSNTNGTIPMAGVDLEPNNGRNSESGLEAWGHEDILFESCTFFGNRLGLLLEGADAGGHQITLRGCNFYDNGRSGTGGNTQAAHISIDNQSDGIVVDDCDFGDCTLGLDGSLIRGAIYVKANQTQYPNGSGGYIKKPKVSLTVKGSRFAGVRMSCYIATRFTTAGLDLTIGGASASEGNTFDMTKGMLTATSTQEYPGPCAIASCWGVTNAQNNTILGTKAPTEPGHNATDGIVFYEKTASADGADATDNDIRNNIAGIRIKPGVTGTTTSPNTYSGNTGNVVVE